MFCPRCSQQASDDVRFCSRCGLSLDAVTELVESGGYRASATGEGALALTPRQRGTRKGALIMVAGVTFAVLAVLLTLFKEDFFVLMLPAALVFTIGLMRMLYGLLLEDDSARSKAAKRAPATTHEKAPPKLDRASARGAQLPPARSVPASVFTSVRADTSDMAAPPSVTESTTRLLEEDK
ncbi:MAG TPA: zinc ribbon domain-containing protein [Pyrinomonadaceae bacterium]|nr:zinc ribbon domain-containing protein [Pyrinomonadaceae bacterium]